MAILLIAGASVLATFLFGGLVTAAGITLKHRDSSATYRLDAVRDRLVRLYVIDGAPRDNQWLEILYFNVSSILRKDTCKLTPLPESEKCPPEIFALQADLRDALEDLLRHRRRLFLGSPRDRAQKRLQREHAKDLLEMLERGRLRRCIPKKLGLVSRLMSVTR